MNVFCVVCVGARSIERKRRTVRGRCWRRAPAAAAVTGDGSADDGSAAKSFGARAANEATHTHTHKPNTPCLETPPLTRTPRGLLSAPRATHAKSDCTTKPRRRFPLPPPPASLHPAPCPKTHQATLNRPQCTRSRPLAHWPAAGLRSSKGRAARPPPPHTP